MHINKSPDADTILPNPLKTIVRSVIFFRLTFHPNIFRSIVYVPLSSIANEIEFGDVMEKEILYTYDVVAHTGNSRVLTLT